VAGSFLYWWKEGNGLAKRSIIIGFRVNSSGAEKLEKIFKDIRRECKNPYASSSRIQRAFLVALELDEELKKKVKCAVCKVLRNDTGI
jgi:hypothetical protein